MNINWLQKVATHGSIIDSPGLKALVAKWKTAVPELEIYVYEEEHRIVLSNIIVPRGQRRQGLGSQIMQDLVDYADQIGNV